MADQTPTHRCKVCSALWTLWPPEPHRPLGHPLREGSWSLYSPTCGKCCDNEVMGDQIELYEVDEPHIRGSSL